MSLTANDANVMQVTFGKSFFMYGNNDAIVQRNTAFPPANLTHLPSSYAQTCIAHACFPTSRTYL